MGQWILHFVQNDIPYIEPTISVVRNPEIWTSGSPPFVQCAEGWSPLLHRSIATGGFGHLQECFSTL